MKPKLGQHFLVDESVLEFESESAQVAGKSVLEIGAGDGRLTRKLLSAGAAHVTAVELDTRLAKLLRSNFHRKVKVVEQDFLKFEPGKPYNAVVGNLPYYITSPILLKLARMEFSRAVLCMQKEVAERLIAEPGTAAYGRLSVFCSIAFKSEILALVERGAFAPVPKVDSCIVLLEKTGFSMDGKTEKAIGALFSHKKKSVRNAVIDAREILFGSRDKSSADRIAQTLKYCGRKVFTLSQQEVLETAREIIKWQRMTPIPSMRQEGPTYW